MEQATNTFNKGLQLDTHPMVQGNDTLTDCLNGTLITMNGNEVILQNDMGNRRIEQAYLPAGYEPVGIKEYGGIIYVACYNPITGKSQIGSFPSPEKRMDSIDNGELKVTINLFNDLKSLIETKNFNDIFPGFIEQNTEQKNFISNFQKLYVYSDDYPLHIGDKFCLYGDISGFFIQETKEIQQEGTTETVYNKIPLISKIFNTYNRENLPYSPKNRLFNLEVGVLNSENNFVDLTNQLVRWDLNGKYLDIKKYSEEYKENTGIFIKNVSSNEHLLDTQSDQQFSVSRNVNKDLKNTYQYKLSGPLCIRESVNSLQSFNISVQIDYDKGSNEGVEVSEVSNLNVVNSTQGTPFSKKYKTDLIDTDSNSTFDCFDIFVNGEKDTNYKVDSDKIHSYDSELNLYTQRQTRIYCQSITYNNGGNNNYECIIAPKLINNNGIPFGGFNKPKTFSKEGNLRLAITYTAVYNSPDNIPNTHITEQRDNEYDNIWNTADNNNNSIYNNSELEGPIYLENLCQYINYDLDRINSGTVQVNEWRTLNSFNKDNKWESLTLAYSLTAYPKIQETYSNFRLLLVDSEWKTGNKLTKSNFISAHDENIANIIKNVYNISDDDDDETKSYPEIIIIKDINNQEFNINQGTVVFSEKDGLIGSRLYNVELIWDVDEKGTVRTDRLSDNYWIMTTNLFNDSYNRGSDKYIDNIVNPSTEEYKNIKNELLTVIPKISADMSVKTDSIINNSREGEILYRVRKGDKVDENHNKIFNVITEKETSFDIFPKVEIDTQIYPKSLISINTDDIQISDIKIENISLNEYKIIKEGVEETNSSEFNDIITLNSSNRIDNSNSVKIEYTLKEQLRFIDEISITSESIFENPCLDFMTAMGYDENDDSLSILNQPTPYWTGGQSYYFYTPAGIQESQDYPTDIPIKFGGISKWHSSEIVIGTFFPTFQHTNTIIGMPIVAPTALVTYCPFGNGESGNPLSCMAYRSYDVNTGQYGDYVFYNCAPTEGTNMIYMKDSNGIAVPKGFIVHNNINGDRGKLCRIISNSNNKTKLCFITQANPNNYDILTSFILGTLVPDSNIFGNNVSIELEDIYLKTAISNYKINSNELYSVYPNINTSTYVDLGYEENNLKVSVHIKTDSKLTINGDCLNLPDSRRIHFTKNKNNNYSQNFQNQILVGINSYFKRAINKIQEFNVGLFKNALIVENGKNIKIYEDDSLEIFNNSDCYYVAKTIENYSQQVFTGYTDKFKKYNFSNNNGGYKITTRDDGYCKFVATTNTVPKINDQQIRYVGYGKQNTDGTNNWFVDACASYSTEDVYNTLRGGNYTNSVTLGQGNWQSPFTYFFI